MQHVQLCNLIWFLTELFVSFFQFYIWYEQISMKDPRYAKYLENIVSNKDLVAFICEDAGDVKRFMQQMHAMKLTVNIFHVVQEHSSSFQPQHSIDRYKYVLTALQTVFFGQLWAPGSTAPLIYLVISPLYIYRLLVYVVWLPSTHFFFLHLFPYLSTPLLYLFLRE